MAVKVKKPTPKKPLTKAELVDKISAAQKITKVEVEKAIKIVTEGITTVIKDNDFIRIPDFVDFKVNDRAARKGRNPQTGKEIDIPATKVIAVRVSKPLKEVVKNGK
jgi:DNA-binding protein HU-beta